MLRKLARGLRSVTNGFGEVKVPQKPAEGRKAAKRTDAGHSKKKGMSLAARKRLSEAMKARWQERKQPKLARRQTDEALGNGQKGQVA